MKTRRQQIEKLIPVAKKISDFIKREGSSPTIREVGQMAGVASSSHAFKIVREMIQLGIITSKSGKGRSIKTKDNFASLLK